MVALFVAAMFIGFVLLDRFVQSPRTQRAAVSAPADLNWSVPKGFYLSEGHTWSHPDSSMGVRVGADALVAHALGAAEKVVLPRLGQLVKAGQPLFGLERQGRDLKIPSSITGRVVALNTDLGKRPELVAEDPYGSGWICAITPTEPNGASSSMPSGEKAVLWLEQEFHRFREFLSMQISPDLAVSLTFPDGGLPVVGSLHGLESAAIARSHSAALRCSHARAADVAAAVQSPQRRQILEFVAASALSRGLRFPAAASASGSGRSRAGAVVDRRAIVAAGGACRAGSIPSRGWPGHCYVRLGCDG